jgi:hypothetical protein
MSGSGDETDPPDEEGDVAQATTMSDARASDAQEHGVPAQRKRARGGNE